MGKIDKAKEKFDEFKKNLEEYKKQDLNETDTRSKLIDFLFKEVLGWDECDIRREGKVDSGYYDYKIGTANFTFIVEAKRQFSDFQLPAKGNRVKIKTVYKDNIEVIEQIRDYVKDNNLSYGVITNGKQIIISKFINITGKNWDDNSSVYYKNLEDLENNFVEFYNLLSKESVLYFNRIPLNHEDIPEGKIIRDEQSILHRNEHLIRNELGVLFLPIIKDVFGELNTAIDMENKDMLKECYVSNDDIKKRNSELEILFADEPPKFDSKIQKITNTTNTHNLISEHLTSDKDINPIVIIGGRGVGKTTFIKYFKEITLRNLKQNTHPIIVYLDFLKFSETERTDDKKVYKEIIEIIKKENQEMEITNLEFLKSVYKDQIEEKITGVWNYLSKDENKMNQKISEFLEKETEDYISFYYQLSQYIKKELKKNICIIFDNVDQLDENDQKIIFLMSQSIYRKTKSIIMLSLREGFYYKWRNQPPFDAFQSMVIHISTPPYDTVIEKRLKYILDNYDFSTLSGSYSAKKLEISPEQLKRFFENLQYTLFETNNEVLKFIGEISYPNIREMLKNLRYFLLSGHTPSSVYLGSDNYDIPIWEVVKSIGLESDYYYRHNVSAIHNIFYPANNNTNHFTKIMILTFLVSAQKAENKKNYTAYKKISEHFVRVGYSDEIIVEEIKELLDYGLVETNYYSFDIEKVDNDKLKESDLRITQIGKYYLENLINRFHYVDLVLQDTPIYDEKYFEKLLSAFPQYDKHNKRNLNGRYNTVVLFIDYLKNEEIKNFKNYLEESEEYRNLYSNLVDNIIFNKLKDIDLNRIKSKIEELGS